MASGTVTLVSGPLVGAVMAAASMVGPRCVVGVVGGVVAGFGLAGCWVAASDGWWLARSSRTESGVRGAVCLGRVVGVLGDRKGGPAVR